MGLLTILYIVIYTVGLISFSRYPFRLLGRTIGSSIRSRTQQRRDVLRNRATESSPTSADAPTKKAASSTSLDSDWEKLTSATPPTTANGDKPEKKDDYDGVIGFFHPFCNAGGGGERVLFAALLATQRRHPSALCVVYTGDHDATKEQILFNAHSRFNIALNHSTIEFLYLGSREWVLASTWPYFTLLGQSLGSIILGWEAFNMLVPDVLVDTMGYAFVLGLSKWLFPTLPTAAYVHYPTISTDMLQSLHSDVSSNHGVNAGLGKGVKGRAKQVYWELFAKLYGWVGGHVDVVMTNSTWTQRHITSLWGPSRKRKNAISVVYPPCAVEELQQNIPLTPESEKQRTRTLIYIAQFRAEKNHATILDAFSKFLRKTTAPTTKLILAGSVRDTNPDDQKLVYKLRLQARPIKDSVEFVINASWPKILELLRTSSVGVNAMWNEHFGIGVVEYQAAGLISVVNNSGGPKEDIVVDVDSAPTGFHASTAEQYATAFDKALALNSEDALAMRRRARQSSLRFSEGVFGEAWIERMETLVWLSRQ